MDFCAECMTTRNKMTFWVYILGKKYVYVQLKHYFAKKPHFAKHAIF